MRQSRITSRKKQNTILAEESFPLYNYLLNLCLSEAFYLPALRATFFQKKASPVAHRLKRIPHRAQRIATSQIREGIMNKYIVGRVWTPQSLAALMTAPLSGEPRY